MARRKEFDSREIDGTESEVLMPTEGDIDREALLDHSIKDVEREKKKLDALAFMEEPVTIMVHESADENAQPIVDVYCNGVPQRFVRGMEQTVKRKFVQILAEAKTTNVRTRTGVEGGTVVNKISRHTAVRYPFSVIEDRNPRGAAWLREALANA